MKRHALRYAVLPVAMFALALGCATTRTIDAEIDDEVLTRQVEMGLFRTPQTSAYDVDVKTFNGRVTLLGEVADDTSRAAAERVAQSVTGVTEVDNQLKVLGVPSETPFDDDPDFWITTKLNSQLAFDNDVKGRNIDVETIDGVVYLTGIVESETEKKRAEAIASTIGRVDAVANLLEVEGSAGY